MTNPDYPRRNMVGPENGPRLARYLDISSSSRCAVVRDLERGPRQLQRQDDSRDVRADGGKSGRRILANSRVPGQLVVEGFTIARSVSSGDMPLNPHVTLEEKARLVSSVVKPLALIKLRRTKCAEPRRPSCLAHEIAWRDCASLAEILTGASLREPLKAIGRANEWNNRRAQTAIV
jgi:hypothetical protein